MRFKSIIFHFSDLFSIDYWNSIVTLSTSHTEYRKLNYTKKHLFVDSKVWYQLIKFNRPASTTFRVSLTKIKTQLENVKMKILLRFCIIVVAHYYACNRNYVDFNAIFVKHSRADLRPKCSTSENSTKNSGIAMFWIAIWIEKHNKMLIFFDKKFITVTVMKYRNFFLELCRKRYLSNILKIFVSFEFWRMNMFQLKKGALFICYSGMFFLFEPTRPSILRSGLWCATYSVAI